MACALSALPPHPNNASFSPLHSAPLSARSSSPPPLKGARWPVPQTTRLVASFFLSAPAQICPQPGLMRACRQTFLMAKPPLPCRKIFACACLSALFAFSSPWFFSFPPFLSICFGQIPEAFYPQSSCRFSLVRRKAALFAPAVFHAPRPFKQTYAPLFSLFPHLAKPSVSLKPRRVPAPAPPFFILIISLALRPFGALRLFRANVFLPVCLAHALPPPLSAPLRRAVSPILPAFFTLF